MNHPDAAVPYDNEDRETADPLHERVDQAAQPGQLQILLLEILVEPDKLTGLVRFLVIGFHDVHPAEIFLDMITQLGHLLLNPERGGENLPAKIPHRPDQEGIGKDGRQSHPHIHRKHQNDGVKIVEGGIDEIQDPWTQEHAHRRYVINDTGHQVSGPLRLIIGDRQLLQMGKEIVPQVVFDVPAGVENKRTRKGANNPLSRRRRDNEQGIEGNVPNGPPLFDDPHALAYPPWDPHDQGRSPEETKGAEEVTPPVAPEITF